eukprot:gene8654-31633_t
MVKGNAERRKELSKLRRDGKKAEGERRKGGASKATPGEARARLLSDAMRVKGTENGLIGWTMVDAAGEGDSVQNARSNAEAVKLMCASHFRTGYCELRRCKHEHTESISHLKGVPPPVGDGSEGFAPIAQKPLKQCSAGGREVYDYVLRRGIFQSSPIRFVEWNNELVFDAEYPEVFAAYCKKQDTLMAKFRKPWSVKLHHNLPSNFRIAVHTVLLSAERFARQPRDGAAATSLLLLPPEIWEKILGYLVRGDWTNDRHGATATSGSPPSGKSASKPSKKHKFKERNGKA